MEGIRRACRDGDLDALKSLALASSCTDPLLPHDSLLHIATRASHLHVCKWLLSHECRHLWPEGKSWRYVTHVDDQQMDALDCALSGEPDIAIVRFLIGQMKYRKGQHRENYVRRLDKNIVENKLILYNSPEVVRFMMQCSREACESECRHLARAQSRAGQKLTDREIEIRTSSLRVCNEHRIDRVLLSLLIAPRLAQPSTSTRPMHYISDVGCRAESARQLGINAMHIMSTRDLSRLFEGAKLEMLTTTQLSVGILFGCIHSSWPLLLEFLRYNRCFDVRILREYVDRLDCSDLSDMVHLVLQAATLAMRGPAPLEIFTRLLNRIPDAMRPHIEHALFNDIMNSRYHSTTATRFGMNVQRTATFAAHIVTHAHSSISAAAFYACPEFRSHFMHPNTMGSMLLNGSKQLVYTLVWESDAKLTQIVCALHCHSRNYKRDWNLSADNMDRVAWIREMYNLRVLLKRHDPYLNLYSPTHYHLPKSVGWNVLACGWLGDMNQSLCLF
jgi:hypothetical protein